jgi:hypothetical protein
MNKSRKYALHLLFSAIALSCSVAGFAQDKERGFNVGFVYPLSVQGVHSKEYSNIFSLHALVGLSLAERGFTVGGFGNMVLSDADGFQVAGFYNLIGGRANGFKAAGFFNTYGDAVGFQAAGFSNFSRGNIVGLQTAGFLNIAHSIRGMQAAGFINIADSIDRGTQAAGFINIAQNVEGAQMAGYINIAKKVKGVQIAGFINIADSSEYPIAPINIIKNGEKYLGITTDENLSTIIALRSGSKKLYGIVGVGYNFKNTKEVLVVHYGLGAHFFTTNNFRLNTESTVTHLQGRGHGKVVKTSLSVLPALKLGNKIEIFAGPSLNFATTTSRADSNLVDHYIWHHTSRDEDYKMYGLYVGYTAGVHVAF